MFDNTEEKQEKCIRNIARLCAKYKYSVEITKGAIFDVYPDADNALVDKIIKERENCEEEVC